MYIPLNAHFSHDLLLMLGPFYGEEMFSLKSLKLFIR